MKVDSLVMAQRLDGMDPDRELVSKKREPSSNRLPSEEGTVPVSRLLPNWMYVSFVSSPRVEGRDPER